jgi:hypothetical protein
MAQQLQNITVGAPGFKGVNTQDSPIGLDPQFAEVADNCVIDRFGRLGARNGYVAQTASGQLSKLGGEDVRRIGEWSRTAAANIEVVAANNKLFLVEDDELTELTLPGGYSISADNWTMVDFNGALYFFQASHNPLVLDETSYADSKSVELLSERATDDSPTTIQAIYAIGAYGRMWVVNPDKKTITWSDTLLPANFDLGTDATFAGSLDLTLVWPDGYDEITGLAGFNGKLIIFGRKSIIVYTGAEDPLTMVLEDAFSGVGCVEAQTIQSIGNDILYLSDTGLRSLSRSTIASETALPDSDVSNNVREDLLSAVNEEQLLEGAGQISAEYYPEQALYLLSFWSTGNTYAFDVRGRLEDGTFRVTTWTASPFKVTHRAQDGTLYVGGNYGVAAYGGFLDGADTYSFVYESPALTFGDPARLKFIKSIRPTLVGGSGQSAVVGWGYGFDGTFRSETIFIGNLVNAEFNVAKYNEDEFSGGTSVTDKKINATGSGRNVRLRISCEINGEAFSLQEMNVQALLGRIL